VTSDASYAVQLEAKFLVALHGHLAGLQAKAAADFGERSFQDELAKLAADPVYSHFAFASPDYVLIRLMGRMSISIGRRLGEIYDKIPRLLAAARFDLTPDQVAADMEGLELDIALRFAELPAHKELVRDIIRNHLPGAECEHGVGIEIRYNFNPNDSARLRKDVDMANRVSSARLVPIYLVFSQISPRDEAIARLKRAGWNFLIGTPAVDFARDLLGLDLADVLTRPVVQLEVRSAVEDIMVTIVRSFAFRAVLGKHGLMLARE
jgi:hypothetical protein